ASPAPSIAAEFQRRSAGLDRGLRCGCRTARRRTLVPRDAARLAERTALRPSSHRPHGGDLRSRSRLARCLAALAAVPHLGLRLPPNSQLLGLRDDACAVQWDVFGAGADDDQRTLIATKGCHGYRSGYPCFMQIRTVTQSRNRGTLREWRID